MVGDMEPRVQILMLPTGNRLQAMAEVEKRAAERGVQPVATHAARGVAHDKQTFELEHRRRGIGRGNYREEAKHIEPELDRCVAGFGGYLDTQVRVFSSSSERGRAAAALYKELFPKGAGYVTRLPFVQEHAEVSAMLERAARPEMAALIAAVPDAAAMLEHIRVVNDRFGKSLETFELAPSSDELAASRQRGQQFVTETAILIMAHFITEAPDDTEGRAYLFEPILRHERLVRDARRRRRSQRADDTVELPDDDDIEIGDGSGDTAADAPAA